MSQKKSLILKLIEQEPGLGFTDIHKSTGLGHGVISHHLKALENEGEIRIKRGKRKIWAFHSKEDASEDLTIIFLRKETCKKILLFLLEKEKANFSQIQKNIGKSPSTTSLALKSLLEKKIVRINLRFPKQYYLEDKERVSKLVGRLKVSSSDELKDRFADTFSYF